MAEAEDEQSSCIRLWRTGFLSLRDEALSSPLTSKSINHLLFSQSNALSASSSHLPSHEVSSDIVFLAELGRNAIHEPGGGDTVLPISDFVIQLARFIHDVSAQASLKLSSSSWTSICDSFGRMIEILLGKGEIKSLHIVDSSRIRATKECLVTIRNLFSACQKSNSLAENKLLLGVLISVIACSQLESTYSTSNQRSHGYNSIWDVQSYAFTMICDIYSRVGPSLSVDIWQSSIQVVRKVMDALASKCLLVEDSIMARFYHSLLQTLHVLLVDPKGSLSGHVAGLVAALKMFFNYGLINKAHLRFQIDGRNELESSINRTDKGVLKKTQGGTYRPPHLRKNYQHPIDKDSLTSSENESSATMYASSDSDFSDSDGSLGAAGTGLYAKTRLAAIVCVQDLCRSDPKSFAAYWTMLLPSSDVLQPRKYEANMISCLLFDPYLKSRIASASTITTMLDGPTSIFLQVAEFKESAKSASFTALSSSLGQILMQLHSGILYLIKHETNGGLLASSFKVMILLISSTPYQRMPPDLLPRVVSSVRARIGEGFPSRSDKTSLMVSFI
ncbi:hypothetical protein Leryth_023327 [Lithospermum erythrorhizon]|nr:hypothetical protein Leryth_023327 [Lithospermum erythrorhizon]